MPSTSRIKKKKRKQSMVAFSATVISAMNVFIYHIVQIEITISFISHVMSQVVLIRKKVNK